MRKKIYDKYFIIVDGLETLRIEIEITRTKFLTYMKDLKDQMILNNKNEYRETDCIYFETKSERELFFTLNYYFNIGTTDFLLKHIICKDGYVFSKKQ